jgi:hypothetical protein
MERSHVVIVMSLSLIGAAGGSPDPSGGECPQGFATDQRRAHAILGELDRVNAAASTSISADRMCFGEVNISLITDDGVMLLNRDADDRRGAARVAHLASHLAQRSRFDPTKRSSDCDAWVDDVLHAEAEAFAIELDVARKLDVELPYAFAHSSTSSHRESLEASIYAFLRSHPNGDANVEPLARGYDERCRGVD